MKDDIWVMSSQGKDQKYNLSSLDENLGTTIVKEYDISSIAKYLLNPGNIETKKKMVGCTIHDKPKSMISESARAKIPPSLHSIVNKLFPYRPVEPKIVRASQDFEIPEDFDDKLKKHAGKIKEHLKQYMPFNRELGEINPATTSHVTGIYLSNGKPQEFQLSGSLLQQANYARDNLGKDVKLQLPPAQKKKGEFDLSELNMISFDPKEKYRLLCFEKDGAPMACVLDSDRKMQYVVTDPDSIRYMRMLDVGIKIHPLFKNQMQAYVMGKARPMVLSFKDGLALKWDEDKLPAFYERACSTFDVSPQDKEEIINMLNDSLYSSIGMVSSLENNTFISQLAFHDFDNIKSMEKDMPSLYNAIKHNTYEIAGKKMYLVDVVGGSVK